MTETQTPNPYPPAPAAPTGGGAGAAALVIGLVVVALGLLQQVLGYTASFWVDGLGGYSQMGLVFTALSAVSGALALVGVIVGAIGIQPSRTRGRLAAAAGLALSAAHLLGSLVGFVMPLVLDLVL